MRPQKRGAFFLKGFGIYVKNNLLDGKHIEAMGASVWLYMWLLDKMTSVNENGVGKVLGGQPITFDMIQAELGISIRTYRRWVDQLRDAGYINTLRTPYGLQTTINKAEKPFKNRSAKNGTSKKLSDVPKAAQPSQRDVPQIVRDVPKSVTRSAKNGTSNKDNTKTIQKTNTNVLDPTGLGPKPVYGSPGINEMFDFWAAECGFNIESRVKANRAACSNLLKKHGKDKLMQLIRGVALTHSDQYAPGIADFSQLQQKLPDLLVWGRKKHGSSGVTVIS
jgi:hypothetical protein